MLQEPRADRIEVGVLWWPSPSHPVLTDAGKVPDLINTTLRWRVAWVGIEV
jgi:hypothetical protein